jgi:hypothetical protein
MRHCKAKQSKQERLLELRVKLVTLSVLILMSMLTNKRGLGGVKEDPQVVLGKGLFSKSFNNSMLREVIMKILFPQQVLPRI